VSGARTITEIVPDTGARVALEDAAARDFIVERYARDESAYVRLNMITTPTGSAVGADGTSETITSRVDRLILGCIRADADAVVVGAQTVRVEAYIVPRRTRLVVVTTSGDLAGHRFDEDARSRVLLVCPAHRVDTVRDRTPGLDVLGVPGDDDVVDPADVVAALAQRGIRRLVCEGGPSLASRFVESGVVDELCVTVAPVLEPASAPFVRLRRRPDTEVAGMLADDAGFSYLRLRVRRPDPSPASIA